ncbi:carbohydrate-binding domain-containing protein [Paenibacillus sp. YIM B09110]|uniref:carbohydrate-binding domain-containing protein n=1 Tax=Paenibacillus sp. YIM B09110 TaxID=3126102 RepID=UPI00301D781E
MTHSWKIKLGTLLLCAALLASCSNNTTGNAANDGTGGSAVTATTGSGDTAAAELAGVDLTAQVEYEEDDAYTDWTASDSVAIALTGTGATISGEGATVDGGKITITAAGTYVVSGKLEEGQLVVNVQDKGVVRLVLNGVDIHNSSSSAIYVEEAGKTIISLQEGTENTLSDGEAYVYPDATTDEPNAALFSHDDLTINGTGKLTVQGNFNNGITSKDKLKITGGTIDITAADDGLMGRDLVAVKDGSITIKSEGDAVKTTYDTDTTKGYIVIEGGSFSIDAGDDGIHSETAIAIAGGMIDIVQSNEGIEAPTIAISGGETSVVSTDDGINVAGGDSETTAEGGGAVGGVPGSGASSSNMLVISGGYLSVDAAGDGLDSNGSVQMSGGTVIVNGPTNNGNGSLDYDGSFVMTGGYLISAGSSGMVQATADTSTQPGILMTFTAAQQAGTLVHLEDSEGKAIMTFAPAKSYQAVFVSSPDLKQNSSYTIYSGGTSTGTETNGLYEGGTYEGGTKVVSFENATVVTWVNESGVTEAQSGMGGPGGRGGGFGGDGGGQRGEGGGDRMPPDGEMPQDGTIPEGGEPPQDASAQ